MPRIYNPKNPSKQAEQVRNTKNFALDNSLTALLPGWRLSKNKKWYMETRQNRSDRSGGRI